VGNRDVPFNFAGAQIEGDSPRLTLPAKSVIILELR
jgi:hypothetical protein